MALIERLRWRLRMLRFALTLKPMRGGAPDPDPEPDPKPDPDPDPEPDPEPESDPKPGKTAEEYRRELREYERNAKKASAKKDKELEELRKQLKAKEDEDKSEHERALEKAREEAKTEALTEVEKERRAERLETAVTRLAAKGITVGEGDKAKAVKFADPEDALLRIDRGISRGDIDADEIYDDEGKVNAEALESALAEIAGNNPHLVGEGTRPKGDPGSRKGDPVKGLEDMSVEDHAKRKYAPTT
jgi:hypothetical protein